MDAPTLAHTDALAAARLLIHSASGVEAVGWSVESLLQRVRGHAWDGSRPPQALLGLEIRDLRGTMVLALKDAGVLTDLVLPPGTYHVCAQLGSARRAYTVTLERGASFDLHVQLPRHGPR